MIPFNHWRTAILWGFSHATGRFCCLIGLDGVRMGRYMVGPERKTGRTYMGQSVTNIYERKKP